GLCGLAVPGALPPGTRSSLWPLVRLPPSGRRSPQGALLGRARLVPVVQTTGAGPLPLPHGGHDRAGTDARPVPDAAGRHRPVRRPPVQTLPAAGTLLSHSSRSPRHVETDVPFGFCREPVPRLDWPPTRLLRILTTCRTQRSTRKSISQATSPPCNTCSA